MTPRIFANNNNNAVMVNFSQTSQTAHFLYLTPSTMVATYSWHSQNVNK
jgi:hypothetical protein